ncbi:ATP-binding cassette domain-containing protein [Neptunomonas phycophila]|jgi:branched-chain amino acid transport system ATP-binding protein|uniref:High-affinity branched-chain amino acid transport ATP-binding protein n=1 Tax=Neptunomonas phycophila TaxID=1572645 RepID=A0AAW7XMV1_9GAMM|nr:MULTISPECIES: ATP-binding cassette domain-containing protein [Neptunomonas]MDN2658316.1 ATP-binding cassette domain-containing protein [Neptunomonas sp. CHC150]MDO6454140.1 ATP-binding cassette domain-containing protein [Neptunomonas phycophila]MDO6468667.1 ATP-binding cassette domain-containing protein [Neptunomonas phycophila]MDO6785559.1 ATP-binding cassette domain-containing protein [Neptunomonas phycophila]MDP2523263.1 ATP-binding cassette domain-containing protein [Neptunomonas phycop
MLKIDKINTHYGPIQALHDVSIDVKTGEIVTLIGANGAGKTTLMMTICGDPRATSGTIEFDGADISKMDTPAIMRKGLAVVPEGRRVFSRLTVQENLHMGAYFRSQAEYQETLEHVLELFPRLRERINQRAGTMSGGEQQMLAIGRAMMSKPRMILLDEPSLGLAPIIIQQIFDIIEQLRNEGVTIFLVEQNANQALRIADRGYVLENGRVVLSDTGDALLTNEAVRQAYLGG